MAIKSMQLLRGLPGQTASPIIQYSPRNRVLSSEGVVVELEDEAGKWIGNFDSDRIPGTLEPILTSAGVAFIFAGQHGYVLRARQWATKDLAEGWSSWCFAQCVKIDDQEWVVACSIAGSIEVWDAQGRKHANDYLSPCFDMQVSITENQIHGKFLDNNDQWTPFCGTLPDLNDFTTP